LQRKAFDNFKNLRYRIDNSNHYYKGDIMKTLKYSRQRECIKEMLITRKDHPTADDLYMDVKEIYSNISLGTIYRNLSLLVSLGEIRKLSCGEGADRFDGNLTPHNHFVCNKCGCVKDLRLPTFDEAIQQAEKYCEDSIQGHITYFYGTCRECKPNKSLND